MRSETRRALFAVALSPLLALVAGPAPASIDLNGPWRVDAQTSPYLNPNLSCIVDIVQSGGAIAFTGNGCSIAIDLNGTIDTGSGAISAAGASDPLLCPTLTITATATATGFAGTFACNGLIPVTGPFTGGLCANGVVNQGEDCDDGNLATNDCCSTTCDFEPSSFTCFADGTVCTVDHCDGAGTCVPVNGPAGVQCESDGNSCTENVCNAGGLCTHPVQPAGSVCSGDFNPCTDDTCDGAGNCVISDNSAPCDDWNSCTVGDTCAAGSCVPGSVPAPAGIACDTDFDPCTIDECDGAGGCQNVDCSLCCSAAGCRPAIGASCAHPGEATAALQLRHRDGKTDKDKLLFKWKPGTVGLADFGDPRTSTSYELCIFDSGLAPQQNLEFQARAPAGGTCAGKPCWRAKGTSGFSYKDKSHTPGGLETIRLKSGADGSAQILVKGRGPNLLLFSGFFYEPPLTAQVRASNGKCWQASFPTVSTPGAGTLLKAKNGQ